MEGACDCPHHFPLCACAQGLQGGELLERSRWLSSLAGWPARVDPVAAARVMAEHGRPPAEVPNRPDPGPEIPGLSPREMIDLCSRTRECPHREPAQECGCGGLAICSLDRAHRRVVNQNDCILCLLAHGDDPPRGAMIDGDAARSEP